MIRITLGFLIVLGAVGREDFYSECLMATDCVAGDPPDLVVTALIALFGLGLMAWGVWDNRDKFDEVADMEMPLHLRKGYKKGATKNEKI